MKVKFLGTGQMATMSRNTSFVADNQILFDIGSGVVEALKENKLDTKDINYIIISHFHVDHFGDIIFFLHRRAMKGETGKKLVIIGPEGLKQKIIDFNNFTFGDYKDYSDIAEIWNIEFVELGNNQIFSNEFFKLKAFKVIHGKANCNGYVLTMGKTKLGYSGDACMCDGLVNNIQNAKNWIIEANKAEPVPNSHVGLNEMVNLASLNKTTNFFIVHRGNYETNGNKCKNILFPNDNDVIEIN